MENGSLPPWAQALRTYRHSCGMVLYMGLHCNDGREWPVFQLIPGLAVLCCPRCKLRVKLDNCRQIGEPREEEELCLT